MYLDPFAASDALFAEDLKALELDGVDALEQRGNIVASSSYIPQPRYAYDTGDKWNGGYGATEWLLTDYWTLRARSVQMFEQNLYGRGVVRRLVTNFINTGLRLEASPEERLLGYPEDGLADWSEDVENRFALLEKDPALCDQNERLALGQLQAEAYRTALVSGDVLCVLRQHPIYQSPRIQLIPGERIQTPIEKVVSAPGQNKVVHGVEVDQQGRHVAFWVRQDDGSSKRLPAFGEKSGRRLAWLLYVNDKRIEDVRGKPFLSLILQSIREIDRYRDSVQLKATINAMLALFIQKSEDKPGTRPLTGGAVRRGTELVPGQVGSPNEQRRFRTADQIPGLVLDELQFGETPHGFQSNGTDEKFGDFEMSILSLIAWGNEIPPEILSLSFNSNYSASKAANNEFDMKMAVARHDFGHNFCQLYYNEWLIAEVLAGRIQARGLLEAYRDTRQFVTLGAWLAASWAGRVKPSVDPNKQLAAAKVAIEEGLQTRDQASKEIYGTKFSKNIQRLTRENLLILEANKPLAELAAMAKAKGGPDAQQGSDSNSGDGTSDSGDQPAKKKGSRHLSVIQGLSE